MVDMITKNSNPLKRFYVKHTVEHNVIEFIYVGVLSISWLFW